MLLLCTHASLQEEHWLTVSRHVHQCGLDDTGIASTSSETLSISTMAIMGTITLNPLSRCHLPTTIHNTTHPSFLSAVRTRKPSRENSIWEICRNEGQCDTGAVIGATHPTPKGSTHAQLQKSTHMGVLLSYIRGNMHFRHPHQIQAGVHHTDHFGGSNWPGRAGKGTMQCSMQMQPWIRTRIGPSLMAGYMQQCFTIEGMQSVKN